MILKGSEARFFMPRYVVDGGGTKSSSEVVEAGFFLFCFSLARRAASAFFPVIPPYYSKFCGYVYWAIGAKERQARATHTIQHSTDRMFSDTSIKATDPVDEV